VGNKLKVQALLTGRITPRKDGIILTVELINVADENVVWSERYERKFADLQDIQLEIARQMCAKLKVSMTAEEEKRLARRYTNNPEAHKLYLIGRHHWFKASTESLKKAEQCFLQAIALDANYALAHAGLADTYNLSVTTGRLPAKEFMPKAKQAAQKALDLDGQLAEAHTAMGMNLFFFERDWAAAENMLKRSVELNPTYAGGFGAYHLYLLLLGRFEEAAKALEKMVQVDPVTPFNNIALASQHYYNRQFDKAIEQGRKVLEVDPDFTMALLVTGLAHLRKAQYTQGVAALEKLRQLDDAPITLANLAYGYGVSGDHVKARKLLDEFNAMVADKKRYVDPLHGAIIHLGLGDKDQTCTWLEKAYAERSGFLVQLKAEPMFDSLRSEPRFVELMKIMNFP
jgi:tetratricopeptide (TPR) repeat protein